MNLFTQHLRDGDNTQSQKQRLINQISNLLIDEKHEYTWTMEKYDKSKTTAQLNYYWGVVVKEGMVHFGYSKKEMDIALKDELLPFNVVELFGKPTEVRQSIAEMKVRPMSDYIDICVSFLGTYGVLVPVPPYKGNTDD